MTKLVLLLAVLVAMLGAGTATAATFHGTTGDDPSEFLCQGDPWCFVFGTKQADTFWMYAGDDGAFGDEGNDWFNMGNGLDRVEAGPNADTIYGGNDPDTLEGDDGKDDIFGDAGWDDLFAGQGIDRLSGGTGNDNLFCQGDANDYCDGGDGDDLIKTNDGQFDVIRAGDGTGDECVFDAGLDDIGGGCEIKRPM